jgi:hypothetical protein
VLESGVRQIYGWNPESVKGVNTLLYESQWDINYSKTVFICIITKSKLFIYQCFFNLVKFNCGPVDWNFCSRFKVATSDEIQARALRLVLNHTDDSSYLDLLERIDK